MSFTAFGAIYKATAALLPSKLDTIEAKAMMFAIPKQESLWDERRQLGGPAHGFAQFELVGVAGVLAHPTAGVLIRKVLARLDYDDKPRTSYNAIVDNDVLMLAYMRCLLWTVPQALPGRYENAEAWQQYLFAWRPGRPHPDTWAANYADAWSMATTV